jgi:hypothetical protein
MPDLWRVVAHWGGGKVGTGFTNFFFTAGVGTAVQASDSARAFLFSAYGAGQAFLPLGVTISFPAIVDVIDAATGALSTSVAVTQPADVVGSGTAPYAAPGGACVTWRTAGVVGGKRVRGRTFLVPCDGTGLQSDGTLSTGFQGSINSAASTFISAAPEFVIWHRPASLAAGGGSAHPVLTQSLQDKVAMLTSRRD